MAEGRGISYYIPPEFRRMGKSALELASALDPAQGIMRGMAASGRAFDSDLPPEERKAAGIEAALETLAPAGVIGIGALAKQPAKAVLMDVLTPTGATKDIAEDTLGDPSRRKFLQGAAAAVPVAAVAPDVLTDIMAKGTKAAAKATGANPLGAAVSQISKLRKQADEMTEVAAGRGELPFGNRNEYRIAAFKKYDEMADARSAALDALDADTLANASDSDLDMFVREFYDYNLSGYDYLNAGDVEHPAYDALVMEMQKRGLHKQTDRKGLDKYPYARAMVEDYGITTGKDGEFPRPADIDEETANKRIADAFSWAAELRDSKLNAVRDNLPVTRVADYDNAVRDVKVAMERLEGIQNRLKDPEVDPFSVIDEKMAAIDEAVPLLANNRGGVSLTNARTEAMITPSMENPGKFRISYIDRKSGEPMGDTENFESMEAAIRDAMGQGYLSLGRFEPQNFANGGGVGSLSREARDMFRGPRGIESLSRFANGGEAISSKQASADDLANLANKIREDYGFDPVSLALEIGVDPELALRLVFQESRGKQSAGSEKGARGLTQLMPGTAEEMGVDINDARDNFIGGMKYLKKMTDQFGLELGLAAYNAGPGNVAKYEGVPPFKETQDYLKIILEPFQGASVQPLLDTGSENYLMSQPVAAVGEYSPRPQLRPVDLDYYPQPAEPMPRPQLRPDDFTSQEALLRPQRTNIVEKYGLPMESMQGIGSLNGIARNMYS